MSDFEEVELTTDMPEMQMNASDYAQVIFHNIAETYPISADIQCHYTVTRLLVPSSRDWVGLYKVGWSSCSNYVYFEWAPLSTEHGMDKDVDCTIVFRSSKLPEDDGEFYQFCYVTKAGQVRGASTPFQFKQPRADDFIEEIDNDHDVLIIKSRTMALEDDLKRAVREREEAVRTKKLLETERDSLLEKLVVYSKKLKEEQENKEKFNKLVQETEEKLEIMSTESKDLAMANENFREKIATLNQEKEAILKRLEDNEAYLKSLQDKIKTLINEKDALLGKCKMLEDEKELFKSHFTNSESTLQGYMREIDTLQQKVSSQERNDRKSTDEMQQLTQMLAQEKKKLERQMAVSKVDQSHIQDLSEKLKVADDNMVAMEMCLNMSKEEFVAVKQAHDNMAELLEKAKTESHSLKVQRGRVEERLRKQEDKYCEDIAQHMEDLQEKEKDNKELQQTLAEMQEQMKIQLERQQTVEKDHDTGTAAMFHLKAAQNHLKERYARMKKERDELKKQLDEMIGHQRDWKDLEGELRREIEDLKERLAMGADEYKTKYIECKRLQVELKKLQRSRGPTSPLKPAEKQVMEALPQALNQRERSEAESQTSLFTEEPEELADLTSTELQAQLDALGKELEQRHAKKQRYKQLLVEEKERGVILKTHYQEELGQKQRELDLAIKNHMDARMQHSMNVKLMRETLESQQQEIAKLKRPAQKEKKIRYPAQSVPFPPIKYPQQLQAAPSPPLEPQTHDYPLQYPNRYAAEAPPNVIPVPSEPEEPMMARGACGGMTDSQIVPDTSEGGASGGDSSGGLPPPMEPEILPSAKLAAVKAVYNGIGSVINKLDPAPKPEDIPDSAPTDKLASESGDDADEDRFLDAEGEPQAAQKICPVCSTAFPADLSEQQFELHIDSHYGKRCPLCQKQFTHDDPQDAYETHVQSHFDE